MGTNIENLEFQEISKLPKTEDSSNLFLVASRESGSGNDAVTYPMSKIIETIENITEKDKGYFSTEAKLKATYPTPDVGEFANVAGIIYECEVSGTWINTGDPAPTPVLNLNEYTLNGGSSKNTQQIDDQKLNHVDLLPYLDAVKKEIQYENPRGSTELKGNNQFPRKGIGFYQLMNNDIVFDTITAHVSQYSSTSETTISIFSVDNLNTVSATLAQVKKDNSNAIFKKNIKIVGWDTIKVIPLGENIFIKKGKMLVIRMENATSTGLLYFNFTADSTTEPYRNTLWYAVNEREVGNMDWGLASNGWKQASFKLTHSIYQAVDIVFPARMYALVGHPFLIYYDAICKGLKGVQMTAQFEQAGWVNDNTFFKLTPATNLGGNSQGLSLRAYNTNGDLIGSANTVIECLSLPTSLDSKIVAFIGDSTTAGGVTPARLRELLSGYGYSNFRFVGSRTEGGVANDGYSGTNFAWFISNASSPFINPSTSQLDIAYYRTVKCGLTSSEKLDIVNIMLGINDIGADPLNITSDTSIATIISNAKTLIAAILADSPNCKIIINMGITQCNIKDSIYRGHNYIESMWKYRKAILTNFDNDAYHANVIVGYAGAFMNRLYGYPLTQVKTSPAYGSLELQPYNLDCSDMTHPNWNGYNEIAYGLVPYFIKLAK